MPAAINSLHFPQPNWLFSHNRRHIYHPLCLSDSSPSPSYHAYLKIKNPFLIQALTRDFQSTVTSVVTASSATNSNFSTDLPIERTVNVRSICLLQNIAYHFKLPKFWDEFLKDFFWSLLNVISFRGPTSIMIAKTIPLTQYIYIYIIQQPLIYYIYQLIIEHLVAPFLP